MLKNYLFDLDGTLLPLNEELFVKQYFNQLGLKFVELGLNPQEMIQNLWLGTKAMIENNGSKTNEEIFWDKFYPNNDKKEQIKEALELFYQNEFEVVKSSSKPTELSLKIIELLKSRGKNIVLATNPIFPFVATKKRMEWVSLKKEDFLHVTTYENSKFTKPSINYYEMILTTMNFIPEETIMIGNDTLEDMVAEGLGIKTFLVTDCLNNKNNIDINQFEHGTLEELFVKIKEDLL
ncbi:MAG: HAD family hydrolase [Candidatus Izemoplasmatales bacterium]